VEYHLDRGLRLLTEPEHKNLYKWAINEADAEDKLVGSDQIPWPWTLHFTATSCTLSDNVEIKSKLLTDEATAATPDVAERQFIRVELRPGHPRDDEDDLTTFSMFGTDRVIKSFQLQILPLADLGEQERCTCWGCVSYTTEVDFTDETEDDCIMFYMFVKPNTFARYAEKAAHSLVDELHLSVGSVAGFYSEWSPSISTRHVKVLTKGSEQKLTLPPDLQFEPPRLGEVGEAELYINRRLEFAKRRADPVDIVETRNVRAVSEMQGPVSSNLQSLQVLASIKRAAWAAVFFLALIFVLMLLRR
jgi:hypothetical protein